MDLIDDEGFEPVLEDAGILVLRVGDEEDDLPTVGEFGAETHPLIIGDGEVEQSDGCGPFGEEGFGERRRLRNVAGRMHLAWFDHIYFAVDASPDDFLRHGELPLQNEEAPVIHGRQSTDTV